MTYKHILRVAVAANCMALPLWAHSATITGAVTSDGHPVRGALVTVSESGGLVSETVLSDANGHYRLDTEWSGHLAVRARAPMFGDARAALDVVPGAARLNLALGLRPLTDAQEISDSLPPSAHFARLKFPSELQRQQFQSDCVPCHQVGSPSTRRARSIEEWRAVMRKMTALADYTTDFHVEGYAAAFKQAFDGTPTAFHQNTRVDEEALKAKIVEWKLPASQFPHDSEYLPRDGKFYTVDQFVDQIYITDPKSDRTEVFAIPAAGVPIGGSFAGENGVPDWVPMGVRHGNHSLALSPKNGHFYMTGSVGGEIGEFDPVAQAYRVHKVGGTLKVASWPHTIRFDSKGMIWFNTFIGNQIGRFDPQTGKWMIVELPTEVARRDDPKDARIPAPYGLDINPLDDSIWFTQVWANKIGRLDPATGQVKTWNSPVVGPHRARFDNQGGFWIPGIGDGKITRLDTKTMKSDTYRIPTLADDEVEAPYVLTVDRRTGNVWVSANQSDRILRFVPKTKKWTSFPLPTRGLYFREVVVTAQGWVCAPSSPIPPEVYGDDGITKSLTCLQPDGKGNRPTIADVSAARR